MNKFKPGDRVRRVSDGSMSVPIGSEWDVVGVAGDYCLWDASAFDLVRPALESVEYEWPCRICDATEVFNGEEWIGTCYQSGSSEKLCYNHRRKIEPEPKLRPVFRLDEGREIRFNGVAGFKLVAYGPDFSIVASGSGGFQRLRTGHMRTTGEIGWRKATEDDAGKPVHANHGHKPGDGAVENRILLAVIKCREYEDDTAYRVQPAGRQSIEEFAAAWVRTVID